MKLTYLALFPGFLFFTSLQAQNPADLLSRNASQFPIQKVYLQLDRENYVAGQTTFFKAYLQTDYLPDTISSTLYTELINASSLTIIKKYSHPIFLGGAAGSIDLPDSLFTGRYLVRSYTPEMAATGNDFAFQQYLFVYGKTSKAIAITEPDSLRLEFFPEGGNLVNGLATTVAFKATNRNGLPVNISGVIRNAKGEEVSSISTVHDGMGMFDITPASAGGYFATISGQPGKYYLPAVVDKGIALAIIPHPQGSFFEIKQKGGDENFIAAYMIGQMQHHFVFRKNFTGNIAEMQGVINSTSLHSGIMQVTVFNKNGVPLAERLCFINNKENVQPATLSTDTLSFLAGGRNRFSILMKDTIQGHLSVAITDPSLDLNAVRENNIISSLLLTADLKGYIHNPAWYFSSNDDSVKNALDLVMMVNGWRRFKWTEIEKQPLVVKKNNSYITLDGRALLQGTKKPFADKQLLLMISSVNVKKNRNTQFLQTDRDGKFRIDSLVFFDKNRLLFTDVRGKKSQYIDVELNDDSILNGAKLPTGTMQRFLQNETLSSSKWKMDYEAIQKANGILLDEVKVKAIKKTPQQVVDENYTSGMFSGDAVKAVDLVNSDEASTYMNIFDYLQSRVSGLTVTNDGLDYGLFYRQGPSISSMGNIPMTIFLDEIETDASVVASIPGNQVAYLKIYGTFAGGWGNSPGGAIAIYTKKGDDYKSSTSFSNIKSYDGYSVTKEFYAPDYKVNTDVLSTDYRTTLDWRPLIFVNSINPRIPISFYNNSRTKTYKVVVEGMTTNGKLISLEKVIGQ